MPKERKLSIKNNLDGPLILKDVIQKTIRSMEKRKTAGLDSVTIENICVFRLMLYSCSNRLEHNHTTADNPNRFFMTHFYSDIKN